MSPGERRRIFPGGVGLSSEDLTTGLAWPGRRGDGWGPERLRRARTSRALGRARLVARGLRCARAPFSRPARGSLHEADEDRRVGRRRRRAAETTRDVRAVVVADEDALDVVDGGLLSRDEFERRDAGDVVLSLVAVADRPGRRSARGPWCRCRSIRRGRPASTPCSTCPDRSGTTSRRRAAWVPKTLSIGAPMSSYGLSREKGGLFGLQMLSESAPAAFEPSQLSQPKPPGASLPSVRS